MDAESLPRSAATLTQNDRELQELRALLAQAEQGETSDDRLAANLFRELIDRRMGNR